MLHRQVGAACLNVLVNLALEGQAATRLVGSQFQIKGELIDVVDFRTGLSVLNSSDGCYSILAICIDPVRGFRGGETVMEFEANFTSKRAVAIYTPISIPTRACLSKQLTISPFGPKSTESIPLKSNS
jgi:hypothetical protein